MNKSLFLMHCFWFKQKCPSCSDISPWIIICCNFQKW